MHAWLRRRPEWSAHGRVDDAIHRTYSCCIMAIRNESQPKPASSKVNFRIKQEDRDLFERAADAHDETLTRFFLESGRERAERLLADRSTFTVGSEGWDAIEAAMDRPAEAKPELVDLFSRPRPQ